MDVTVKLFASLRQNRQKLLSLTLPEGCTVISLLESLGIPRDDVMLLLVNGRDANVDQVLQEGDTVSLFPPSGGG